MNRFKQIDVLRAVAVFLVLGRHLTPCPSDSSTLLHRFTAVWAQGGWMGVDLFFVLSGFLVSGLLFREHEKFHELRIGHFLVRRGLKIYPPFWLLIGATVVLLKLGHQDVPLRALASELLFVQNYGPALWNHTWSLAVEEHFYLLLAFGAFLLARRRSAQPFALIPVAFITVASLCLLFRVVGVHVQEDHYAHLLPSHLRLDSLFFGVLLSYLYHRYPVTFVSAARRFRYVLAGLGALSLLPAFCLPLQSTRFIYTYGLTLFYLGGGCLLVAALGCDAPATRLGRVVAYIGSHSYSVYLWHMPVAVWGTAVVKSLLGQGGSWSAYAATYLIGSLAFGVGMAILIEFPVLRVRDSLFPSRGTPLSSEATRPAIRSIESPLSRPVLGRLRPRHRPGETQVA
jgi:peptidoglycan/LPS O-acetylase OafA/YrhL